MHNTTRISTLLITVYHFRSYFFCSSWLVISVISNRYEELRLTSNDTITVHVPSLLPLNWSLNKAPACREVMVLMLKAAYTAHTMRWKCNQWRGRQVVPEAPIPIEEDSVQFLSTMSRLSRMGKHAIKKSVWDFCQISHSRPCTLFPHWSQSNSWNHWKVNKGSTACSCRSILAVRSRN